MWAGLGPSLINWERNHDLVNNVHTDYGVQSRVSGISTTFQTNYILNISHHLRRVHANNDLRIIYEYKRGILKNTFLVE